MTKRQRLDLLLLQRGLASSREQAQQLIRAGWVRQAGRVLDKPGTALPADAPLEVEARPRFVSRGGDKLEAALQAFAIPLQGRVCLDAGLSTGGFSDCLLQRGARRIYGIDVGYGQVAWSLRTDPRMVLRERTNVRHLLPDALYGPEDPWPDLAVADLSFISLTCVLPALGALLRAPSPDDPVEMVLLVKPQFEVGREGVGKGGVVRDPAAHGRAIARVLEAAEALGWQGRGLTGSPITGPAGNHEYLLWLASSAGGVRQAEGSRGPLHPEAIQAVVAATLRPAPLP
ncbi:MAG: TlyA family RNA methyltransferase [Cyanobacteriota bacterium]|nr:TlyA family RNA methyltransferase [Cyanobacteriota bacterium]